MNVARQFFASPGRAFATLREAPVFALPMWLTLVGITVVTFWYYSKVDVAWLSDQMTSGSNMSATQQEQVASRISRPLLLWSSGVVAPLIVLLFTTIGAAYFLLAGNIVNLRYSFRQWFALSWWSGVPQIIAFIPTILILAFGGSQVHAGALQPLSLNELVFHRDMTSPGYSLLSSVGLVQVASVWLTYIAIRSWSGRSAYFSFVFALLPSAIVYGTWASFAFS